MNISLITNILPSQLSGNLTGPVLEVEIDSPYPSSPAHIKAGKFFVVTEGYLSLSKDLHLGKGTIFSLPEPKLSKAIRCNINSRYKGEPIIVIRAHTHEESNISLEKDSGVFLVDSLEELKKSKCTLEALDDFKLGGKEIPKVFTATHEIQPFDLLLGDVIYYSESRELGDLRLSYSLNNNLEIEVSYQMFETNSWVEFDCKLIKPDLYPFSGVIELHLYFKYKETNHYRLVAEIPDSNLRKSFCESIFRVAPYELLKEANLCMQELSDLVLNNIGYDLICHLMMMDSKGTLDAESFLKFYNKNCIDRTQVIAV